MFNNVRYVFWMIATLAINYSSIPFAISLIKDDGISFPSKELVAILLVVLVNIGSAQMFLAIRYKESKKYVIGLYAIMGIVVSFLVLAQMKTYIYFIILLSISILVSLLLLMSHLKKGKEIKALEFEKKENEYKRPNPKPLPEQQPKKRKKRKKRIKPTKR